MENITNLTNQDYSSYVTQAQTSNLTNQIKKSTSSDATDEEMLAACKEFEAYLVEQVYKQVQSTIKSDSDEDDNPYADYAYDLQAQQYAKLVRVMTPKPPICISMIMMNNPSGVNVEETSTETNPVTQMALVAVNRASIKEMP